MGNIVRVAKSIFLSTNFKALRSRFARNAVMPLLYLGAFMTLSLGPLAAPAWAVATTSAPVVTDPASATSVSTSTYSIKGTVSDASVQDVQIYQDVNNNGAIDSPSDTVVASGNSLNDKSFSVSTPLSLGANNFLVTATKGTQNESAAVDVPTITRTVAVVDTTPPTDPTATPGSGTYSTAQTVTLSSSDNSGAYTIYYTTDGSPPSNIPTAGILYTGPFTVSVSEPINAIAYDAVGNHSGVSSFTYTITPASGRTINSATVDGAASTTVKPGDTVTGSINVTTTGPGATGLFSSLGWAVGTTAPASSAGYTCDDFNPDYTANGTYNQSFDIDTTGLVDGTYNLYTVAYQHDSCNGGDSNVFTLTGAITIDSVAPVVTVNSQTTTDTTPTVTGTVIDTSATTVSIIVNGHIYNASVSGSTWSADVTDALTAGTTYNVVATATDAAGNSGSDITTNELVIQSGGSGGGGGTTTTGGTTTGGGTTTVATVLRGGNNGGGNGGQVLGASTGNTGQNGQVLGAATTDNSGTQKLATTTATKSTSKHGKVLGLMWYWWLLILGALFIFFIAWRRRNAEEN